MYFSQQTVCFIVLPSTFIKVKVIILILFLSVRGDAETSPVNNEYIKVIIICKVEILPKL